jgi:hypothetical protein
MEVRWSGLAWLKLRMAGGMEAISGMGCCVNFGQIYDTAGGRQHRNRRNSVSPGPKHACSENSYFLELGLVLKCRMQNAKCRMQNAECGRQDVTQKVPRRSVAHRNQRN